MDGFGLGAREKLAVSRRYAGKVDFVDMPIFDTQTIVFAAAGSATATYFQVPYGSASKTLVDTNMAAGGYITNGLEYHIKAISFQLRNAVATAVVAADARIMIMSSTLSLNIADKLWFQAPCWKLGGGGGVWNAGTFAATDVVYQNGMPTRTSVYRLRNAIVLPKNVNFVVTVFTVSPAITVTAQAAVVLEGTLVRPGV